MITFSLETPFGIDRTTSERQKQSKAGPSGAESTKKWTPQDWLAMANFISSEGNDTFLKPNQAKFLARMNTELGFGATPKQMKNAYDRLKKSYDNARKWIDQIGRGLQESDPGCITKYLDENCPYFDILDPILITRYSLTSELAIDCGALFHGNGEELHEPIVSIIETQEDCKNVVATTEYEQTGFVLLPPPPNPSSSSNGVVEIKDENTTKTSSSSSESSSSCKEPAAKKQKNCVSVGGMFPNCNTCNAKGTEIESKKLELQERECQLKHEQCQEENSIKREEMKLKRELMQMETDRAKEVAQLELQKAKIIADSELKKAVMNFKIEMMKICAQSLTPEQLIHIFNELEKK